MSVCQHSTVISLQENKFNQMHTEIVITFDVLAK